MILFIPFYIHYTRILEVASKLIQTDNLVKDHTKQDNNTKATHLN